MTGIYGIYNWMNGKWYVGQSVDIKRRKTQERCYLKAGNHIHSRRNNEQIAIDWQVYGPEAFVWVVLEECTRDELDDREVYWITKKNSYKNGYNQTTGGTGSPGRPRKGG